jgi:hypothetical protein
MDIFQNWVWFAFVGVIIISSIGYSIIINSRTILCNASMEYNMVNFANVLASTALFPLHIMLGSDVSTNSMASKIICLSIGLMSCIMWSYYSSDMMSRDGIHLSLSSQTSTVGAPTVPSAVIKCQFSY